MNWKDIIGKLVAWLERVTSREFVIMAVVIYSAHVALMADKLAPELYVTLIGAAAGFYQGFKGWNERKMKSLETNGNGVRHDRLERTGYVVPAYKPPTVTPVVLHTEVDK